MKDSLDDTLESITTLKMKNLVIQIKFSAPFFSGTSACDHNLLF